MLQIVIWGVAIMLVVKGLDIVHSDAVAAKTDTGGAPVYATIACIIAFVGAAFLIVLAGSQTREMQSSGPPPITFGN